MTTGVYVIENEVTGHVYVGSSMNVERRIRGHLSALQSGISPVQKLQEAWNSDGKSAFRTAVLEVAPAGDMLARAEQKWIDQYADRLYNGTLTAARNPRETAAKVQVTITLDPADVAYLDRLRGNEARSLMARQVIRAARERDEQERANQDEPS
jgi:group I intron endonuclease